MSELRVNFSDVPSGFEPVPAGKYVGTIVKGEAKVSGEDSKKYPNTPMINWHIRIDHNGRERRVFYNTMIHEDLFSFLKDLLIATEEYDVDGELAWESNEALIAELLNKQVGVQVGVNKDEDNFVKRVIPVSKVAQSEDNLLPT